MSAAEAKGPVTDMDAYASGGQAFLKIDQGGISLTVLMDRQYWGALSRLMETALSAAEQQKKREQELHHSFTYARSIAAIREGRGVYVVTSNFPHEPERLVGIITKDKVGAKVAELVKDVKNGSIAEFRIRWQMPDYDHRILICEIAATSTTRLNESEWNADLAEFF